MQKLLIFIGSLLMTSMTFNMELPKRDSGQAEKVLQRMQALGVYNYEKILPYGDGKCPNSHYLARGALLKDMTRRFSIDLKPMDDIIRLLIENHQALLIDRLQAQSDPTENYEKIKQNLKNLNNESHKEKNTKLITLTGKPCSTCPEKFEFTPLMLACAFGSPDAIAIFLNTIDVNVKNFEGRTALHDGLSGLFLELLCLQKSFKKFLRPANIKRTLNDYTKGIIQLLYVKATQDACGPEFITPLMLAANAGLSSIAGLLLYHKADTTAKDYQGKTASYYALESTEPSIKKQLIELKTTLKKNSSTETECWLPFAEFEKIDPLIKMHKNFKQALQDCNGTYLASMPTELLKETEKFVLEIPNYE